MAATNREELLKTIHSLLQKLEGVIVGEDEKPVGPPAPLRDLPGFRITKTIRTSINFLNLVQQVRTGTISVDPGGPFIVTQMQLYWRFAATDRDGTSQAANGILAAPTTFTAVKDLTDATATSASYARDSGTAQTLVRQIPEFEFQLQTSGDGRFWTGQTPIPASAFYGFGSGPLYLGVEGWVNPRERIVVHAHPVLFTPRAGSVEVVFSGYQILNPNLRITMPLNWVG